MSENSQYREAENLAQHSEEALRHLLCGFDRCNPQQNIPQDEVYGVLRTILLRISILLYLQEAKFMMARSEMKIGGNKNEYILWPKLLNTCHELYRKMGTVVGGDFGTEPSYVSSTRHSF